MPVIEYVRFDTDDVEGLLTARDSLIAILKRDYADDFISAQLGRSEDGSITELITWASAESASRAANEMPANADAAGFFARIGTVHEVRHSEVLHQA